MPVAQSLHPCTGDELYGLALSLQLPIKPRVATWSKSLSSIRGIVCEVTLLSQTLAGMHLFGWPYVGVISKFTPLRYLAKLNLSPIFEMEGGTLD